MVAMSKSATKLQKNIGIDRKPSAERITKTGKYGQYMDSALYVGVKVFYGKIQTF